MMKCSTLSAFLIIITRKCKCSAVGETVLVPEACLSKKCTCDLVRYFVLPNCLFHLQILTKLWMSNDMNSFLIIHSLNCFCKFLRKRYLYLFSILLFFTFLVDSQEGHNWTQLNENHYNQKCKYMSIDPAPVLWQKIWYF